MGTTTVNVGASEAVLVFLDGNTEGATDESGTAEQVAQAASMGMSTPDSSLAASAGSSRIRGLASWASGLLVLLALVAMAHL